MDFFCTVSLRGEGGEGMRPHHKFVVIAPMIMKFGTGIKFDVFYTVITRKFATSLLLRNYDVITCILARQYKMGVLGHTRITSRTCTQIYRQAHQQIFYHSCNYSHDVRPR